MFDLHVHAGPDVWPRLGDDRQILRWYAEAGFSGCVLKGHYDATMGRAFAASAGTGLRVYGGLALNQHVGGINPAAVAAALAMGRSEEHTSELQSLRHLVCRLLL